MSRYTITVTKIASRHADPDAVIGYDRPLQTFFLQAFPDEQDEDLDLWLGTEYRAFETLSAASAAAIARRLRFYSHGIRHASTGCSTITAREAIRRCRDEDHPGSSEQERLVA